jgi:hypothetical protein
MSVILPPGSALVPDPVAAEAAAGAEAAADEPAAAPPDAAPSAAGAAAATPASEDAAEDDADAVSLDVQPAARITTKPAAAAAAAFRRCRRGAVRRPLKNPDLLYSIASPVESR